MEESLEKLQGEDLLCKIEQKFSCDAFDIKTFSPLTLAYIGDAVFDLVIRSVVVERANRPAHLLHKTAVQYVNAPTQAKMIMALKEELTQEEEGIFRRGKNAKPATTAKNASLSDYHKATGLEALMGYLYLTGQTDRMLYLIHRGIALIGMEL